MSDKTIVIGQLITNNASDENFKPYPNIDAKYGPYESIADCIAKVPIEVRSIGLTVGIKKDNVIREYWWQESIANSMLVLKTQDDINDGKTPKFVAAEADTLPAERPAEANITLVGTDEEGNPEYKVRFGIPAGFNGQNGQDGFGTRTLYTKTSSYEVVPSFNASDVNPGSMWSASIPKITGKEALWSISARMEIDGTLSSPWEGPVLMSGIPGADGEPGKDGADGSDGADGAPGKDASSPNWKTTIFKKADSIPDRPTEKDPDPSKWTNSNGWVDYPDSSDGQWWQCVGTVDGTNDRVISWSAVIPVNGRDGEAQEGRFTEFRFAIGEEHTHPSIVNTDRSPVGWTIAIPEKPDGKFLYMTSAIVNPDNTLYKLWDDPVRISGETGPVGDTGPTGSKGPTGADGIDGIPGVSMEGRYCLGTETMPDATYNSTVASTRDIDSYGWTLSLPETTDEKMYIWCVLTRIKYRDNNDKVGTLERNWSNPYRITGIQGLPGKDGKGQIIYPEGVYSQDKVYTCTEDKAPYVLDTSDGNFYVMNYVGTWKGADQQVHKTPYESVRNGDRFWIKLEAFEAVYSKIGIIANGLIGSAVFNGDWMFSQKGQGGVSNFEDFNASDPYNPANSFIPAFALNFKTGDVYAACGKIRLQADGTIISAGMVENKIEVLDSDFTVTKDYNYNTIRFTKGISPTKTLTFKSSSENYKDGTIVRVIGPHKVHLESGARLYIDNIGVISGDKTVQFAFLEHDSETEFVYKYIRGGAWKIFTGFKNYGEIGFSVNAQKATISLSTIFSNAALFYDKEKASGFDPVKGGSFFLDFTKERTDEFFPTNDKTISISSIADPIRILPDIFTYRKFGLRDFATEYYSAQFSWNSFESHVLGMPEFSTKLILNPFN